MKRARIAPLACLALIAGCALPETRDAGEAAPPPARLLLYGGGDHGTYLGCLTCMDTDPESVHNPNGSFGSRLSPTSILNSFSEWGSRLSNLSVCNPLATDPPLVMDEARASHGRLTVNRYNPQAYRNDDIQRWLETEVCR